MKLKITEALIALTDFEVYTYPGEEGTVMQSFLPVCVTTVDGEDYFLPIGERCVDEEGFTFYRERYHAQDMLDQVRTQGVIQPEFWIHLPKVSLEDRWAEEAEVEAIERMEFGAR